MWLTDLTVSPNDVYAVGLWSTVNMQGTSGTGTRTHRNAVSVFLRRRTLLFATFYVFGKVRIGLINGSRFCQNIENVCRVCRAVHTLKYFLYDVTVCASTSGK